MLPISIYVLLGHGELLLWAIPLCLLCFAEERALPPLRDQYHRVCLIYETMSITGFSYDNKQAPL
jgi:hypothetical protein